MIYGSVCSGIEAASAAWHSLGWRPAFFSEIEAFPRAVLKHHHPDVPLHGDFTTIKAGDYAAIDVLVGGTPCQSFSVAGLRGGLDDERGNLALEFCRLARRLGPRWVVWENVPGVLSLDGGRAFASILGGLAECGYGLAYRVLDAQYVRVDGFGRAVPQRRRRVFVVGHLGSWQRAAAVLFERQGLCWDTAPRRQAGQGPAPTLAARTRGGGGLGTDFDCDGELVPDVAKSLSAARGQACANADNLETYLPVAATLTRGAESAGKGGYAGRRQEDDINLVARCDTARYTRIDWETETFVAHALRADGFDASEDGTGRGTPLVPTPYTLAVRGRGDSHNLEYRQDGTANAVLTPNGARAGMGVGAICFDETQITSAENRCNPQPGDPCHPLAKGARAPTLAYAIQAGALRENPESGPDGVGVQADHAYTLEARAEVQAVITGWRVRRLTPVECERLQGFPDNFTAIPYRGKPAADGPRYKALGNSMAVNVMRWIGQRMAMVEQIAQPIREAAE